MKKLLFISTLLLVINTFGQKLIGTIPGLTITNREIASENDTLIKVIYKNGIENNRKPVCFINGKQTNESILRTLNPNEIATLNIEKKNIEIDNIKYHEQLYIVTKSTYNPKLISLNNLKAKYTNLKKNSTVFKIDDDIINAEYDNFIVDEKFILKIIVEKVEKKNEKLIFNFINLITKSEENIKKSKEIIIRGKDEFTLTK
jgi:hypothetical protein